MVGALIALLVLVFIAYQFWFYYRKKQQRRFSGLPFPEDWRSFLREHVAFYRTLKPKERVAFERAVQRFFDETQISGASADVTAEDRLLVAAAAVIPVFRFGDVRYPNLEEVVIYPDAFDHNYNVEGPDRAILGMVGNRHLNGTVLLSKKSLWQGFRNDKDGQNTAIHEFVHLIDGWDGETDGLPELLLSNQATLPWFNLIREEMERIEKGRSVLDQYGAHSPTEFFAVAAEHFFENPKRLKKKHPELYAMLREIFLQTEKTSPAD